MASSKTIADRQEAWRRGRAGEMEASFLLDIGVAVPIQIAVELRQ
jgi:hypothetical protein